MVLILKVFKHIDILCSRIRCVIEQIVGLAQYSSLFKVSSGLMRPKSEDLELDDEIEVNIVPNNTLQKESSSIEIKPAIEVEPLTKAKTILDIVKEENEEASVRSLKQNFQTDEFVKSNSDQNNNENEYEQSTDNLQRSFFVPDQNDTDKLFESQIDKIESNNKKLIQSVNKLFSTEQRVELDSKNILNTTQSLSRDDLILLSINFYLKICIH